MLDSRCSVLVSSSDKYFEAWEPFFVLYEKYWQDCPFQTYLIGETINYDRTLFKGQKNEQRLNVFLGTYSTWSKRLIKTLKKIKTKYVIFLMEDYFFLGPTMTDEIYKCLDYMDTHNDVSVFNFEKKDYAIGDRVLDYYFLRLGSHKFWLSAQPSVWRKKDLLRLLSPHENPWQMEQFGTERAKMYNKKHYLMYPDAPDIMHIRCNFDLNGVGIVRGKWLLGNKKLFEENNISVDFSNLGMYDEGIKNIEVQENPLPKKTLKWKWLYLRHGGSHYPYIKIRNHLKMFFTNPKEAFYILKIKMRFIFDKNFFNR